MKSIDSPAVIVALEGGQVNAYLALPYFVSRGNVCKFISSRGQLKCDGTNAETRFHLLAKRTSPFKSAGVSVQLTSGSRGVRISGSNAGYTTFRGSVKGTGYLLHSPVPIHFLSHVSLCANTFQLESMDGLHNLGLKMAASATAICDSGFSVMPAGGSMT